MLLEEIFELTENAKLAFARRGTRIVRRYRCTTGKKAGRIVKDPSDCGKAINPKRRIIAKKTAAQKGRRMARKRRRTMKRNPLSQRLQRMNKSLRKR
ncbi:MAG: hypothetical protein WC284_07810 [Candidimonas sp.]